VKPPGMNRIKRCKTLGENYSEERIRERIRTEDLSFYQAMKQEVQPEIMKCYVKRYRRAKMSGIQKRYYAKLYSIGKLKKKPYSQAWKYKNDIKKMQKLQQQYLFLVRHNVHNVVELATTVDNLTGKKKEASKDKSRVYRSREKCKTIFAIADELEELKPAENSYLNGDKFFEEEHNQWINLTSQLQQEGYFLKEVEQLKEYYREQYSIVSSREKVVFKELNLGKSIVKDMISDNEDRTMIEDKTKNKITERTKQKQPIR
jgi:DNA-binding transcriptional MerR regulator